jgi:hypothetical protein
MDNQRIRIVKKFRYLSEKYHTLSLLFYELAQSLNIELKPIENSRKKIKEHLKKLNLDIDKIEKLSLGISEISLYDIKKE